MWRWNEFQIQSRRPVYTRNRLVKLSIECNTADIRTYGHTDIHTYIHTHIHTYIHTYIHTHTYTYIHIHTHTYTYIHIHIHTHTYTYIHTYIRTYTYITYIHTHTYIHTYIHTHTYIHIHTHTYTFIHPYIHIHTHTYTYIHIHTHTYTYIHIHTYTYTSIYIHIHTHTYTYIHIHTHTYTYIHIHTHTYTYIHIHTHTNTYIHIHTHTYTYIHIHTYIHTYTRTYVHTYIVKCSGSHPTQFVAELPRTSMKALKVPHLPRKSNLICWKCHACDAKSRSAQSVLVRRQASADTYEDTATQIELEVLEVWHLPRKKPRRPSSPSSSPSFRRWHLWRYRKKPRRSVLVRRQASAGDTESSTPATQIKFEVLKLPRQPRKKPRRPPITPSSSPSFRWHLNGNIPKVPRLPRKSSRDEALKVPRLPCKKPWRPISPSPSSSPRFRGHLWNILPCKSSLRCWKRHTCRTKSYGAQSILVRRQASADFDYGDAESTTPATQIEPWGVKASRLPRKKPRRQISLIDVYKEISKASRLPRKSSLRCWKCHACHAKSRGAESVLVRRQASADIYGDTESTTPATQIEPDLLKVSRLPRKKPRRPISPIVRRQASAADIYGDSESILRSGYWLQSTSVVKKIFDFDWFSQNWLFLFWKVPLW